jgi:adenosylhomocysteinase
MEPSRIKDPGLAAQYERGEVAWLRYISPITEHYAAQVTQRDYHGKRMAYWGHITPQNALILVALHNAGVDLAVGACNVDSTDDVAAAYVASLGVHVYGWQGMSQSEYEENKAIVRAFDADYLCDMGGELCVAYLDRKPPVIGALEATTSGLNLLKKHDLPFPVFDWNSIPLKDLLENRFHVGDTVWPVFGHVTGMGLTGKRVLVIGFGPVGKGIAARARSMGAVTHVADLDPVRLLEARHYGHETVSVKEGMARCHVVVTATGAEGVLGPDELVRARPGAILFNAGHTNREIDIGWLYRQPGRRIKAHIERFDLAGTHVFLLVKGSLLNLASGTGIHGVDMFDQYTAVMLLGMAWMFDGIPDHIQPGLQLYPAHLEREIAELAVRLHR